MLQEYKLLLFNHVSDLVESLFHLLVEFNLHKICVLVPLLRTHARVRLQIWLRTVAPTPVYLSILLTQARVPLLLVSRSWLIEFCR
jgi:hypothetical protein